MSTQQVIGNYICNYGIIPSTCTGGDAVEIFQISEDHYGLYLLDLSGHGHLIINIVTQIKELILQLANAEQKSYFSVNPQELMQQLNTYLYSNKLGKYLTLLYGVLDLKNNCFNYSVAGHYPNPILLNNKGYTKYLFSKGVPLGILKNASFEKFSIPMSVEDAIILFSDGIVKFFMPESDIEDRSNYLLELISQTQAEYSNLLQKLNLQTTTSNITDDIIITIIKRQQ